MTTLTRGNYLVEVVADSVGPHGARITTLRTRYPLEIHAEVLRHRVISHSVESSRAVPPEIRIKRVREQPFVPETFNGRVKGMGVGDKLSDDIYEKSRQLWLEMATNAADQAQRLLDLGNDKTRVNRSLSPYSWVTDLMTATEWSNLFALRQPDNDDPVPQIDHGAAPEMQILARMMRDAMRESTPRELGYGDWHLPYVDRSIWDSWDGHPDDAPYMPAHVSAGRCFVSSYDRLDEIMSEPFEQSVARYERGVGMAHWSPMEHPAICCKPYMGDKADKMDDRHGPLRGWRSLREFHPNEHDASIALREAKSA